MLRVLLTRLRQGHRTMSYPKGPPPDMPDRFRGRPVLHPAKCLRTCARCEEACPTGAARLENGQCRVDLANCLFCGACETACPSGAITFTREPSMAARTRDDLVVRDATYRAAEALDRASRSLFGRSLRLRQVSAGGCNACEADSNVLTTLAWDIGRFGIQFVASPRHADGLLITGPVTENMRTALLKTYAAVPSPKIVIAVGACAIGGGPFRDHPEVHNGAASLLPVDLFIPGCPPHPMTILDGLLRVLGRVGSRRGV